jgi:hypothetical protein
MLIKIQTVENSIRLLASQEPEAHTYNPNYLGDRDRRIEVQS